MPFHWMKRLLKGAALMKGGLHNVGLHLRLLIGEHFSLIIYIQSNNTTTFKWTVTIKRLLIRKFRCGLVAAAENEDRSNIILSRESLQVENHLFFHTLPICYDRKVEKKKENIYLFLVELGGET